MSHLSVTSPNVTMVEVIISRLVTCHPVGCDCYTCWPWQTGCQVTTAGPGQTLIVSLADGEPAPPGWQRVPAPRGLTSPW